MNFLIFHEITFRTRKMKKKNLFLKFFLFFGKWKVLAQSKIFCVYFGRNFQSPKNQNLLYFSQKSYEEIFPKTLSDNNFHFFYNLNQTILLVYKNIESFILC